MRKTLLIAFCFLLSASGSFAQDIYTYTNLTSGAPDYVDPLISVYTSLTAIGASTTTSCASGFSGIDGWPTSTTYSSSGACIQVTLTASPGYSIKSTGFTAGLRRSGTGPAFARLAYSTDGITWIDDGVDHSPTSGSCATSTSGTTLASWTTFCVTNTTLYFRIYPFDASGSGGTIQVYGLDIIGSVVDTSLLVTPVATAAGPTSFCPGGSVVLNATTGTGYTYQWYNSTAAITGATSSSYTATSTDNYYVSLTSSSACTDTSAHIPVTVNPIPAAAVSASGPVSFCLPGSVTLSETSGTGTSYQWYNTSGIITGATTSSYIASATDRDSVMITNSFGCSDTSAAIVITATTLPVAIVSPSGPLSFCPGSFAILSAATGTGYTYQWYNGTSAITGATDADYTAGAAGAYSVAVTEGGGCTAASNAVIISLYPAPAPAISASGPVTFCTPGSVTLTETSGTGSFYQWYNGSTLLTGATNSTYTTAASGNFNVDVTNSSGCSTTSAITTVTANLTPLASATPAGPLSICTGSSTVLTADAGIGYTYQWYDGASAIPGATNISYTASTAGNYSVAVTGAGGCMAASNSVTLSLYAIPSPAVSASGPLTFCSPGSVVLTETSGTGIYYQWYNGVTVLPGATTASYTASTSGNYKVIVTNSSGCYAASSITVVTENITPTAVITPAGPVNICAGSSTILSASVGAGYIYQWYSSTGPIPGAITAFLTAATTGNYHVNITGTGSCSAISNTVDVNVNPLPVATASASGSLNICPGNDVVLTGTTGSGYLFQWNNAAGPITGATDISYTAVSAGTYYLVVTNGFACTANSASFTIFLYTAPSSSVTYSGPLSFCSGGNVVVDAEVVMGDTYQWYDGGTVITGATTSSYTATSTGDYYAIITSINGCITTTTSSHIVEIAAPYISPSGATTFCSGGHVILTASTSGASGITYQWIKNGINISGATGHDYAANASGDYTCLVTISATCFSTTNDIPVLVHPSPDPVINFDGYHLSTGSSFATYQWYVNTVAIPGATTFETVPTEIGSYRVDVTDTFGCNAISVAHNVYSLGVNNINGTADGKIYPNPVTDILHIAAQQNVRIVITSIAGSIILDQAHALNVDVSALSSGIYIVMLYDDNGKRLLIQKLVKE